MSSKKDTKSAKRKSRLRDDGELTIRTILKGTRVKEYRKLKDDFGVSTDTEALRVIIRELYKIKFSQK